MNDNRGFTLTEVSVVLALAAVVTMGIVSFYLHAQETWMDASAQALAQRDATTLIESINARVREADDAEVLPCAGGPGDSLNSQAFFYRGGIEIARFFWNPDDSLVHFATNGGTDQGPVVATAVERFSLSENQDLGIVRLDSLRVRATTGQSVAMVSTFGLYNRWGEP